ncbi:MAG TPA: hemolysin III family protein [Bacteroidales bacterium]|nr:hemolysin III family protein [Bacteroidales bacterium]
MEQVKAISRFSKEEEMANALSHFAGAILSAVALALMLIKTINQGNSLHILSSAVFGTTMIILYLSSTMTHYLEQGRIKNIFFSIDKIAIYLLIAGTYTPLALVALSGSLGWIIFGIEWSVAIIGSYVILKNPVNFEKGVNLFTVISYAVMGWLIIIAIVPLINTMETTGWILVLAGGIFYTIGIFFYRKGGFKYHHLVWHLFVMAGTASHFLCIYFFVLK